jgi:hypothetical protein
VKRAAASYIHAGFTVYIVYSLSLIREIFHLETIQDKGPREVQIHETAMFSFVPLCFGLENETGTKHMRRI